MQRQRKSVYMQISLSNYEAGYLRCTHICINADRGHRSKQRFLLFVYILESFSQHALHLG